MEKINVTKLSRRSEKIVGLHDEQRPVKRRNGIGGEGGAVGVKVTHRLETRLERLEPKRAFPDVDLLCGKPVADAPMYIYFRSYRNN